MRNISRPWLRPARSTKRTSLPALIRPRPDRTTSRPFRMLNPTGIRRSRKLSRTSNRPCPKPSPTLNQRFPKPNPISNLALPKPNQIGSRRRSRRRHMARSRWPQPFPIEWQRIGGPTPTTTTATPTTTTAATATAIQAAVIPAAPAAAVNNVETSAKQASCAVLGHSLSPINADQVLQRLPSSDIGPGAPVLRLRDCRNAWISVPMR